MMAARLNFEERKFLLKCNWKSENLEEVQRQLRRELSFRTSHRHEPPSLSFSGRSGRPWRSGRPMEPPGPSTRTRELTRFLPGGAAEATSAVIKGASHYRHSDGGVRRLAKHVR